MTKVRKQELENKIVSLKAQRERHTVAKLIKAIDFKIAMYSRLLNNA